MAFRRKNMLDALRKADPVAGTSRPAPTPAPAPVPTPARAAEPVRAPPASPRAAEPVRPAPVPQREAPAPALPRAAPAAPRAAPAAPRAAPAALPEAESLAEPRVSAPRQRLVLLAVCTALVALVAIVASRSRAGDTVSAASPSAQPAAPPATQPSATPSATAPAMSAADKALRDPANRWTVRLVHYPADERGRTLANEVFRHISSLGLPIASPITLADGSGIELCAGAAPVSSDLNKLRDQIRALRYPPNGGRQPFSDAYADQIQNVLPR